jgi:hypothetical protein
VPAHPADLQTLAVSQVGDLLALHSLAIYDLRWTCNCAREEREQARNTYGNLISRRDWGGRAETAIDMKDSLEFSISL